MKIIKDNEIKEISDHVFSLFECMGWKEIKGSDNLSKISDVEQSPKELSSKEQSSVEASPKKRGRPKRQGLRKEQSSK
jgi:hypothetical protein